jgi:hypothetical protein
MSACELDAAIFVAERVDALLDVGRDGAPLRQIPLPLLVDLRLGEPRCALSLPEGAPGVAVVGGGALRLLAHGVLRLPGCWMAPV